jgi:hypothetical protein
VLKFEPRLQPFLDAEREEQQLLMNPRRRGSKESKNSTRVSSSSSSICPHVQSGAAPRPSDAAQASINTSTGWWLSNTRASSGSGAREDQAFHSVQAHRATHALEAVQLALGDPVSGNVASAQARHDVVVRSPMRVKNMSPARCIDGVTGVLRGCNCAYLPPLPPLPPRPPLLYYPTHQPPFADVYDRAQAT